MSTRERKGRAYWENHVTTWQERKIGISAYCKENDLNLSSFSNWRRRIAEETNEMTDAAFIEVSLPRDYPGERRFEVETGGIRFTFHEDVNHEILIGILKALRGCGIC